MRWITGLPLAVLVVLFLLYAPLEAGVWVVLALLVLSIFEYTKLLQYTFKEKIFTVGIGTLLFYLFVAAQTSHFAVPILMLSSALIGIFADAKTPEERLKKITLFAWGMIFLPVGLGSLAKIFTFDSDQSREWIFSLLVATFLADTMAYLFGKSFGKHKLCPAISPGKTWEGLLGSFVGAIVGVMLVRWFTRQFFLFDARHVFLILVFGSAVAVTGVLGDLSESILKRAVGVKDSGNLIPGHGGILDRLDGLYFTAPTIWFLFGPESDFLEFYFKLFPLFK